MKLQQRVNQFMRDANKIDSSFIDEELYKEKATTTDDVFLAGYLLALAQVNTMLKHYKINPEISA